jgi:sugar phosphate isomerase/epimerase
MVILPLAKIFHPMKRRTFIGHSLVFASGSVFYWTCKPKTDQSESPGAYGLNDFGVQLWTVRELMAADPAGTLKAIAEIGYKDVESSGYSEGRYYGMAPAEFKKMLEDTGLKMRSGHVSTGRLMPDVKRTLINEWEGVCEDAATVGQKAIFCGYFEPDERKTLDDYKSIAEIMNRCGEKANEYGLIFGHHNHDFEFFPIDGKVPMDILFNETDSDKVRFELDLYWTKKAGVDTFSLFDRYPGRFPFWHVKDMTNDEEQFFAEVGSGSIDFRSIFDKAEQAGMQHFYVEQDECRDRTALESIRMSYDYLRKM